MSTVNFSISGDFITDHFRSLVREGEWRDALNGLKESLVDIPTDTCFEILSGRKKLTGENELFLEDDNKSDEWLKEQYYPYFKNLYYFNDQFYELRKNLRHFERSDLDFAFNTLDIPMFPAYDSDGTYRISIERANYYKEESSDVALFTESLNDGFWMVFKTATINFPIWLNDDDIVYLANLFEKNLSSVFNEKSNFLETYEFSEEFLNKCSVLTRSEQRQDSFISKIREVQNADIDELKKRISEQADKVGGWITLETKETGTTFKIPKNPWLRWCLKDNPLFETIEWNPISPSGLKMFGDDPFHSDWFLLTGLRLDQAHDTDNLNIAMFFEEKYNYFTKMTNSNITPLSKPKKDFKCDKSKVFFVSDPYKFDFVEKESVVVIPDCSPDYEMLIRYCSKNNCIVISETGGKLCHLANVSRETSLPLYLLPNAVEKLSDAQHVSIDTKTNNIEILDYSGLRFQQIVNTRMNL